MTEQQDTLWQIAQEVGEGATLADDTMGGTYCMFCTGELGYSGNFHHTSDCIVTKARSLLEWRKAQPKIEVKLNHQSGLSRLVDEARQQIERGEYEDGGFDCEVPSD